MNRHIKLDELKRRISCEILSRFNLEEVRRRSLSNLERWKDQGAWGLDYEEWLELIQSKSDSELLEAMVGFSEESDRLRQSMPYVGMLEEGVVEEIRKALGLVP